jgi:hypothetical protein
LIGIAAVALVLALHLGFPRQAVPVVLAGFTDTPTFTPEPPTNTPVPPTNTPKPSKPKPTSTPVPATPTLTAAAVAVAPPEAPSTGGLLDFHGLVWLALALVLGMVLVWGLARPGSARRG